MKRYFNIVSVSILLCGGSSCTDDIMSEQIVADEILPVASDASMLLVDAVGCAVKDLSPNWNRYYLQVNVPGAWRLDGEGGFVVPTVTHGEGPQLVPVIVGENWTSFRQGALTLITDEISTGLTRGEADSTSVDVSKKDSTRIVVSQLSNANLQEVKSILSSNKGAGYGYSYSGDYCLGTTLEIFNMRNLDSLQMRMGYHFIDDDYCPHVEQTLVTGKSKEECNNKLAINASLGVEYNKVNVKVDGNYSSSESENTDTEYARSRVSGVLFSREVHHYNILAVAREDTSGKLYKELYSPGFRMVAERLKKDLAAALSGSPQSYPNAKTDSICKVFCEEVGPCLISKSVMGCCLDYSMSIKTESMGDSMTCGGSLELKIKFATASVDVSAEGQYAHQVADLDSKANFECSVYGGEVMGVSILASGGSLRGDEVTVWQQSVLPSTAVMVDMRLSPIYSIIYDEETQSILREYENRMISASNHK